MNGKPIVYNAADAPPNRSAALIDMTGERRGRLVVLGRAPNKGPHTAWACRCDCGVVVAVRRVQLNSGTRSCGCLSREVTGNRVRRHGLRRSPEYMAWMSMKNRCLNGNDRMYPRYGGRGIAVCPLWRESFAAFFDHIGPRPNGGCSLDRIDNDGNYEPGNVRWAPKHVQLANRSGPFRAKLSPQLAAEIRRRRRAGERCHALATSYGVCLSTISDVLAGKVYPE